MQQQSNKDRYNIKNGNKNTIRPRLWYNNKSNGQHNIGGAHSLYVAIRWAEVFGILLSLNIPSRFPVYLD